MSTWKWDRAWSSTWDKAQTRFNLPMVLTVTWGKRLTQNLNMEVGLGLDLKLVNRLRLDLNTEMGLRPDLNLESYSDWISTWQRDSEWTSF